MQHPGKFSMFLVMSAGLISACIGTAKSPNVVASPADRTAVLATLDSWNQGWASRDAALAVADYAEDADWTNAFGDRFQGKAELRDGLEFIFSLGFVMAGTSLENEYEEVEFQTPDLALIRSKLVRTGQQRSDSSSMPDRHIHHLRVVQRRSGRWEITDHLISQAQEKR